MRSLSVKRLTLSILAIALLAAGIVWSSNRGRNPLSFATRRFTTADANRPAVDPATLNRRTNLLRRLSDPLSLQDFSNRGLLDRDVAGRISALLAAGKYREALAIAEALPKTAVGNRMCSISVWKEWAVHERDAALDAWSKDPEAHGKNETQGLIWGLAEMEEADRFDWIKERARTMNDPAFSALIVSDLASQWLLSGEIAPGQFIELAGLLPEGKRAHAIGESLNAAAIRCQELVKKGRLDKREALSVLHDFLGVEERLPRSAAAEASGIRLGSLAVEMEGLLPTVDFYEPPGPGLLRDQYLEDIGRALKPYTIKQVADLAATGASGSPTLWRGYLTTLDLRQDFTSVAEGIAGSKLPDAVLKVIASEALRQSNDPVAPFTAIQAPLDALPASRIKDVTLAAMANELEKAGKSDDAEAWRAKIQDTSLIKTSE